MEDRRQKPAVCPCGGDCIEGFLHVLPVHVPGGNPFETKLGHLAQEKSVLEI